MGDSEADAAGDTCGCKVGAVGARYGLSELDDDLVTYWTGEGDTRYSTRKLATYVNQAVLEAALDEANVSYRDGEVENTYRLLVADDVSSGARTQTRIELEQEGVDVGRVERDFVSHQTVYNHLTGCLGASMDEPDDEERLERSAETLGALQNRALAVTTDTVDRLATAGALDVGEYSVLVSVTITCEDCGNRYAARDLLERGGCECDSDEPVE